MNGSAKFVWGGLVLSLCLSLVTALVAGVNEFRNNEQDRSLNALVAQQIRYEEHMKTVDAKLEEIRGHQEQQESRTSELLRLVRERQR